VAPWLLALACMAIGLVALVFLAFLLAAGGGDDPPDTDDDDPLDTYG